VQSGAGCYGHGVVSLCGWNVDMTGYYLQVNDICNRTLLHSQLLKISTYNDVGFFKLSNYVEGTGV